MAILLRSNRKRLASVGKTDPEYSLQPLIQTEIDLFQVLPHDGRFKRVTFDMKCLVSRYAD